MSQPTEQQQQTAHVEVPAPPAEPGAWYAVPIGSVSVLQAAILFVVGLLWSAGLWAGVEKMKKGYELKKPYSRRVRHSLVLGPLVVSMLATCFAWPATLTLVGVEYELSRSMVFVSLGVGFVGWAGAAFAHDLVGDTLVAVKVALIRKLRGTNESVEDGD